MYTHILVPLDGSEVGESALPHAIELATLTGARITLFNVIEVANVFNAAETRAAYEKFRLASIEQVADYLKDKKAELEKKGISVEIHYTDVKSVADSILDTIELLNVDIVAMSTHGRTGIDRWRFGSIAEKIVRHSPVPVLVVRPEKTSRITS